MTRRAPMTALGGVAVPLAALAVAGCGGGGASSNSASAARAGKTTQPPTAHVVAVGVAKTGLGKILVNSHGRTLYLFKGASGTRSAPASAFAAWPPLRVSGKPTAGAGAQASLVGTTMDAAGKAVVSYNGRPLYTFVKDHKRGDTSGEGVSAFGGIWLAVSPAGHALYPRPASSSGQKPASPPATPTPTPRPAAPSPSPSSSNGIPQNNGGDHDSDNNGGPSDGDGGV